MLSLFVESGICRRSKMLGICRSVQKLPAGSSSNSNSNNPADPHINMAQHLPVLRLLILKLKDRTPSDLRLERNEEVKTEDKYSLGRLCEIFLLASALINLFIF